MELQDLRVFISVYEACNFQQASKALSITQSSVSWRIRRLEREVSGALFVRLPRGVRPTPKADTLYRYALRHIALLKETERAMKPETGAA